MASRGLFTCPAIFADLKVLVKASMPISNSSVDRKGKIKIIQNFHMVRDDLHLSGAGFHLSIKYAASVSRLQNRTLRLIGGMISISE